MLDFTYVCRECGHEMSVGRDAVEVVELRPCESCGSTCTERIIPVFSFDKGAPAPLAGSFRREARPFA
jgi:putative FmdB family regulatory protein